MGQIQSARMSKVLVTGAAGFIGFHLSRELLASGFQVIGVDAITDYYDVDLKRRRHAIRGVGWSRRGFDH